MKNINIKKIKYCLILLIILTSTAITTERTNAYHNNQLVTYFTDYNNDQFNYSYGNQFQNIPVNVSITADDTSIDYGDNTRIRWNSDNADYCTPSSGTSDWNNEDIGTSGTFYTRSLTSNKTFRITCYNNTDSESDSVTIRVDNNNNDFNNNEPDVSTRNATSINNGNATLNGRVDGNGSSVRVWFEYGTNTNFGHSTSRSSYGSGSTNFSKNISGLYANTTYYFRVIAENSQDIVYGNILSFNTNGGFSVINNQPTVVISADQTNIAYNESTTIRWNATNAISCSTNGGSIEWAGAKSTGPGSLYTGPLTASRTYTMTCNNNAGSATNSVTVNVRGQVLGAKTTTVAKPALTSLILINSSVDRNQPIISALDNTKPKPGEEINYTVSYKNIGTGAVSNVVLQIILPQEVSYMFSNGNNPSLFGSNLVFNLETLGANSQGTVTVRMRVRDNVASGTNLNFPAILSYVDPSLKPQSVNANVSAQVWVEPVISEKPTETNDNASLGANVFGAGFLPTNLFGWTFLLILVLLLVLIGKYLLIPQKSIDTATH